MGIYINSIEQISIQEPLSENWFLNPICYNADIYNPFVNPDFKPYFTPVAARRLDNLLKCTVVTAKNAVDHAGTALEKGAESLQGIILGTGLGSIDMTEKFLVSMIENKEEYLQPTAFTNSTYNTLCTLIAQTLKCHGYNTTYSHSGISFDTALFDGMLQLKNNNLNNVMVCGGDHITEKFFTLLQKIDFLKSAVTGQVSLSMLLSNTKSKNAYCRLIDGEIVRCFSNESLADAFKRVLERNGLSAEQIDATVINAPAPDNKQTIRLNSTCLGNRPMIWYKHIFGESLCASAFGIYVAATCLKNGTVPSHLLYNSTDICINNPKIIAIYNNYDKQHSIFILQCLN